MGLIGGIQKRPWLLLTVIFVAMLAFILGGSLNGNGGGPVEQSNIGTVNGVGLTSAEYQNLVDEEYIKYDSTYRLLYGQTAPAGLRQQLNEQYIGQYLSEQMLQAEYNKLGINVTKEEFNNLIQGKNVDGSIYENFGLFLGPDRKFSQDSLDKNVQNYLQDGRFNFIFSEMIGKQARISKKEKKYMNMISKGLYVTSHEAKKSFEANSNSANFDYVYRSFASVSESEVTITDADLKAYYNKHKSEKKYEQKDKFKFQYAEFPIKPSDEDLYNAKSYLDERVELFKIATNDTSFIITNSDTRNFDFTKIVEYPKEIDSILRNSDSGAVVGPYLSTDGEYYQLSKLISYQAEEGSEEKILKVVTIDSEIRRSKETISEVRNNSLDFVNNLNEVNVSDSVFISTAANTNITIVPSQEVALTQARISGIEKGFNTIKKWAFSNSTKAGDVSDDFVFDRKVIIAHLISKSAEGTPSFEELSENGLEIIKAEVLKEKQAEVLKSKMTGNSLDEIAKNIESTVQKAENITLETPLIPGAPALEPKIVGTAFGMEENAISGVLKGETGMFVLSLKSIITKEAPADLTANKQQELDKLRQNVGGRFGRVMNALREKSNLEDNRDKVNILEN